MSWVCLARVVIGRGNSKPFSMHIGFSTQGWLTSSNLFPSHSITVYIYRVIRCLIIISVLLSFTTSSTGSSFEIILFYWLNIIILMHILLYFSHHWQNWSLIFLPFSKVCVYLGKFAILRIFFCRWSREQVRDFYME